MARQRSRAKAQHGDLERAVLDALWSTDSALTVREVHGRLGVDRDLAYTTVMTVLDRMAKKGTVLQERDGRAYRYRAASTREQMAAELMNDALEGFGAGDRRSALLAFVDGVSAADRRAIAEALRQVDEPGS